MFKKAKEVFGLGILSSLFLINIVSAVNFDNVMYGVKDFFGSVFGFLLNTTSYDAYFFEKILFFFILFLIIRIGLEAFPPFENKRGIVNIISIAISLISVRYLTELDLVKGILIPYGTMATAILTILPFIIFFFFIHRTIESKTGRKIAWIFYMIILFGIWANRSSQLNDLENYIYVAIFIISLILFFFDSKVREYFELREAAKGVDEINRQAYIDAVNKFHSVTKANEATGGKDKDIAKAQYEAARNMIKAKRRL